MKQAIYMKVTHDKYELPIAVADSPEELGRMLNIKSYRSLKQRCKKSQYDFRMVEITTKKEVKDNEQ